jgi:hypothetical protein
MPKQKRSRRVLSGPQRRVRDWIGNHKGKLSEIARRMSPPVSQQFVSQVAYGICAVSGEHPVARALRMAGCPLPR